MEGVFLSVHLLFSRRNCTYDTLGRVTRSESGSAWVNTANDFRVSFPERLNQNSRIGVYHMFSNHFLNLWENPLLVQQL